MLGWYCIHPDDAFASFYPNGSLGGCKLKGNQTVQGIPCQKATLFGVDPSVSFYAGGNLSGCSLDRDYVVRGMPCHGPSKYNDGQNLFLYENGRVQRCQVSRDFDGWRHGEWYGIVPVKAP